MASSSALKHMGALQPMLQSLPWSSRALQSNGEILGTGWGEKTQMGPCLDAARKGCLEFLLEGW